MSVREIDPRDAGGRRAFIALERALLGSEPLFVGELIPDLEKQLSGRSAFFHAVEHALFVADEDGRDVARCAALVNRAYQDAKGEATGFVGYFAAAPDADAAVAGMLDRAEAWLAARGVTRVVAPFNAAGILGSPLRVGDFDRETMFPLAWHPPAYERQLVAAGYRRTYPMLLYDIDFAARRYRETSERALTSPACQIRPVDVDRWNDELELVRRLFNETFPSEWEMHPYTAEEWQEAFGLLRPLAGSAGMFVAEVQDVPVGFAIGFLDWTPLMRSFRGRLGPLKLMRFMRRGRRAERGGLAAIGVRDAFRGRGISQALTATLFRHYERAGHSRALYYLVNEHNAASRGVAESFGGEARLAYAWLDKPLG